MDEIKKIAVIGAGVMGHGIAQVYAMAGYEVIVRDIKQEILEEARKRIEWSLGKMVEKKTITQEQATSTLSRIKFTLDMKEAVKDADYILEAIPERVDLKREVFKEIDELAPEHAIISSNTSTIPATILGDATKRPDRVVNQHWFNPPVLMRIVEIVPGEKTSYTTVLKTYDLLTRIGKEPIILKKDIWGFVGWAPETYMAEASWIVFRKEATAEEIDATMRYKLGFPMGPLEVADLAGLDVMVEIGKVIEWIKARPEYARFLRGPIVPPSPLYESCAREGKLGMKSGEGYYKYPGPGVYKRVEIPREKAVLDPLRILVTSINYGAFLIRDGVSIRDDIDKVARLGLGYPRGLFEYADEFGIDKVVEMLRYLKEKYGDPWYEPDPLLVNMVEEGRLGLRTRKGFYEYISK
jgi:enoyl-CoA hydratase/3-hydroxyacyl-CoA dehydrogenase